MNAHSAARAAGLVLLAGLAAGNVGCKHARRVVDACLPPADCATPAPPSKTVPPAAVSPPAVTKTVTPCPDAGCAPNCAPSVVEVRQTPPVHVKVPRQDVVVELPPHAAPQPPVASVPPMAVPPMAAPMPGGYVSPVASGGMVPTGVTHVPTNRARLGFTFDTIRIPFPILRPIAVPTQPVMTMAMPLQPVAVPQPVAVQPVAVQPVAVQPQPIAVQPVAVQPQPIAVQPVAVQPPPQVQYVQPVAPPQMQVVPQAVAPQAPTAQSVDEYCRQVDALMRALEASKRAAGCPPTVLPPR